ncbi:MAG: DNA-3-methyladenine glycosylase 2 family protein [Ilumatobacteraceae bacterium]
MPTAVRRLDPGPTTPSTPVPPVPVDLARTLSWYRHGRGDPTTSLQTTGMARASWTPDGPATVVVDWSGPLRIDAWGPGADHARRSALAMTGIDRPPAPLPDHHRLLTEAARRFAGVRTGASGDLYHALLPTILAQRITGGEAVRQWARLCHELGEPAPGPDLGLVLPPRPERLAGRPAWWFHPLGIEAKRARALTEVARIADRLWRWVHLPHDELATTLSLVRGIGPWTVGEVMGPVCGDDDAVAVGDYHLPNVVAWNLAGEPRADDARMLALLEPFHGQRGRVLRLLGLAGSRPPMFGPRQRILPMHRW